MKQWPIDDDVKELRRLLKEAGLTIAEMSRQTGVAYTTLQDWFGGKHRVSPLALSWLKQHIRIQKLEDRVARLQQYNGD